MGPHWALLPKLARRTDGRGRPWRENRAVLNGILWILRTGAPWADLPDRYPSYQTCHRRFQQWVRAVLRGFSRSSPRPPRRRLSGLQETFIDGSFAPAKQGGPAWARRSAARLEDHGDRRSPRTPHRGFTSRVHTRRKTVARCVATNGGGRSSDSLPGSRTFGGLVVRYERFAENFLGMLHLACCLILLRGL